MLVRAKPLVPVVSFALLTVILFSLFTWFLLWDYRNHALGRAQQETVAITRMFVEQTERTFESVDLVLKGIQDRLQSDFGQQFSDKSPEVHLLLGSRALGMRQLDSVYYINEKKQIVNSSIKQGFQEYSFKPEFVDRVLASEEDVLQISMPRFDPLKKEWFLHLGRKVVHSNQKRAGALIAVISVNHFEEIFKFFRLQQPRPASLYRADGILIASEPIRSNMLGQRAPEISDDSLASLGNKITIFNHTKGNGAVEQHTLAKVPDFPLIISVVNDTDEVLAAWRENSIPIIFAVLFVTGFLIIAAISMSTRLLKEHELKTALADATGLYEHTVDSVMDAIIAANGNHVVTLFNPAAERMFGYRADEVLGKNLSILLPTRFRDRHQFHVQGFQGKDENYRLMDAQLGVFGLRKDGSEFPIESTISKTEVGGKVQLTAVLRDVTDRRQSERELRDMNQQLRGLSASLQNVREQERSRIARELHDELGQQLTGLKLELSWMMNRIKENKPLPLDKVDTLRVGVDKAIQSVRQISTELRPVVLDDLGFGEAVAWQANEFSKRTGIRANLNLNATQYVQKGHLATALFRIVQESLTNVMRYADADLIYIDLVVENKQLVLRICDDGVGLAEDLPAKGFGLVSMRERANALGGDFRVFNMPERGACVEVKFDLNSSLFAESYET